MEKTDIEQWHPTPKSELITAERLSGNGWEACLYQDLKRGDIFRAIIEGQFVSPLDLQPDDNIVSIVLEDAKKNDPLGSNGQNHGYGVIIDVFDNIEELKRKKLS